MLAVLAAEVLLELSQYFKVVVVAADAISDRDSKVKSVLLPRYTAALAPTCLMGVASASAIGSETQGLYICHRETPGRDGCQKMFTTWQGRSVH